MDEFPRRVRDAAIAAFDEGEIEGLVLDLVADTLVDPLPGRSRHNRQLRFAGHGRVAEVAVRETRSLTLDVRLSPDRPAVIELRTADGSGRFETQRQGTGRFTHVPAGLTTVFIHWTDLENGLARTASVYL
jgi:hypothetical protein